MKTTTKQILFLIFKKGIKKGMKNPTQIPHSPIQLNFYTKFLRHFELHLQTSTRILHVENHCNIDERLALISEPLTSANHNAPLSKPQNQPTSNNYPPSSQNVG